MTYARKNFPGVYRATVVNNRDPQNQRRLKVSIVTSAGETTDWIWPMEPSGITTEVPEIGQGVWVFFQAGDHAYPVWFGEFGTHKGKSKKLYIKPLSDSVVTTDVEDLLSVVSRPDGTKEVDLTSSLFNVVNNRAYGSYATYQTVAATTSNQTLPIDQTFCEFNGVNLGSGNTIVLSQKGTYYIDFSFMFTSSSSSTKHIESWLVKDGTPVAMSNTRISLSGNGQYGILAASLMVEVTGNSSSIKFGWWADSATVSLTTINAANGRPGSPAAIINVFKVK